MRHWAEEVAKTYLEARGYTVLAENYTVRGAEIDLVVARDGLTVIVEVRQRRSGRYGTPAETLTPHKLARLQGAALHFIAEHYARDDLPLRFDAVFVSGDARAHTLEHLEGIIS